MAAEKRARKRRFPFRARNAAEREVINARISEALLGVEKMILKNARGILPARVSDAELDEILQRTREHLWQCSLPKYDTYRKPAVKLSTFIWTCASNYMYQERRALARRLQDNKTAREVSVDTQVFQQFYAADNTDDDMIAKIAQKVLDHPEKYLQSDNQVQVMKAVLANPGMKMKDIAVKLGYKRPSSLSMIVKRIQDQIVELGMAELDSR